MKRLLGYQGPFLLVTIDERLYMLEIKDFKEDYIDETIHAAEEVFDIIVKE